MIFNGLFILFSISLFLLFNPAFPLRLNSNPSLYSSVCCILSPVRDLLYIIDFSGQTKDILFAFLTRENLVQMRSYVSREKLFLLTYSVYETLPDLACILEAESSVNPYPSESFSIKLFLFVLLQ